MVLDGKAFMETLHAGNQQFWRQAGERASQMALQDRLEYADVIARLQAGAYNEMRNAEVCAGWFSSTPEIDVRIGLARQIYDETRHYKLLTDRLRELGEDPGRFTPLPEWDAMYEHFARQQSTLERLAGMQFVGENMQCDANERWIERVQKLDPKTAALYREQIGPDEEFHAALGRRTIARYATTPRRQAQVRAAVEAARRLVLAAFMAYNTFRDRLRGELRRREQPEAS